MLHVDSGGRIKTTLSLKWNFDDIKTIQVGNSFLRAKAFYKGQCDILNNILQ
jgi:hypothetical protein